LCCGTVRVKPNIREFLPDGNGIIFEDGSEIKNVDHVRGFFKIFYFQNLF